MLNYQANGNLDSGIHDLDLAAFKKEFGTNVHRQQLIAGLEKAIKAFKSISFSYLYIDGSFVTQKPLPSDIDICYVGNNTQLNNLYFFYPVFLDFSNGRQKQKQIFGCEFFPATELAAPPRSLYLDFFQTDKTDGSKKGIIRLLI